MCDSKSIPKVAAIYGLALAFIVGFDLSTRAADIPAALSVGAPRTTPGDGLYGEYWKRDPVSIPTDGNTNPDNRIDVLIEGFGPASGTFDATVLTHTGNDLTDVVTWLGADAASFTGTADNLDDGAFRFTGYINVAAPGVVNLGTTSDDGSRITIGGIDLVNNDGGHGDATVDADANFEAAGVYPIEITYWNGDWTSDNSPDGDPAGINHSGNPDPAVHGGANFHLRVGGATITPEQVATYLYTTPLPNYVPGRLSVGTPPTTPGDGLYGEYWQRDPVSIPTDGATNPDTRIDVLIEGFGPATGSFDATVLTHTGNDLTDVVTWLGADGASFDGTPGNLDDGAFRFTGFISVTEPGVLSLGTTSDDGSRITIGGLDMVNNDGSHGDATVDSDVTFEAAGVYPIEITYWNGDWTSDNSPDGDPAGINHSGNPDPSVHGGANFHLRMEGATVTPAHVEAYLYTAPTPNYVPARLSVSDPLSIPGDGLNGEYWQRDPVSIPTDGNTNPDNRIDVLIEGFGPASGSFNATVLTHTGNDLTDVVTWLGADGASFTGTPGNLDDGAFRFRGFINVTAPGVLSLGTTSDDGSRLTIGGIDLVNNDGGHGDATVDTDVNFGAAGVYPIEITYWNGDWTSDNSPDGDPAGINHSGNPDPSVHGGANFHLRVGGATITPAGVEMLFRSIGAPSGVVITSVTTDGSSITFSWEGGEGPFLVQGAADIAGPWLDLVTTAERTTTQPIIGSYGFFRIEEGTTRTISQHFVVLTGAAERPDPVDTPATGSASVSIEGNQLTYLIAFQDLTAPATMGHIHGPAGTEEAAGVLIGFPNVPADTSGMFSGVLTLDDTQLGHVVGGMTYINIHTSTNTGGEIRGQILP